MTLRQISKMLVAIGAINWGLVGAYNFNLVNAILGSAPSLEKIVYVLVGLAGVYSIYCSTYLPYVLEHRKPRIQGKKGRNVKMRIAADKLNTRHNLQERK